MRGYTLIAKRRLQFGIDAILNIVRQAPKQTAPAALTYVCLDSYAAFCRHVADHATEYANRNDAELSLVKNRFAFRVPGYCFLCHRPVRFRVNFRHAPKTGGRRVPNWRESLSCYCGLNNRQRAAVHLFELYCAPHAEHTIYLTEQKTPLYYLLSDRYRNLIGSEYLAGTVPRGTTDRQGIRNESLTAMTFPDASFDFILSYDVFEHIPDYHRAFRECLRCLKPGGKLLFTVPFNINAEHTITRAKIDGTGRVIHLFPPEYHGNPLTRKDCLCYYHFGWDLLDDLRGIGYRGVEVLLYWSREYGYLGGAQPMIVAIRA